MIFLPAYKRRGSASIATQGKEVGLVLYKRSTKPLVEKKTISFLIEMSWLTEMVMENPTFMDQYEMDSLDDVFTPQQLASSFEEGFHQSYSSESFSSFPNFDEPYTNNTTMEVMMATDSWNSCNAEHLSSTEASPSPNMLSFGHSNSPTNHQQQQQLLGIPDGGGVKLMDEVVLPEKKSFSSDIRSSQSGTPNAAKTLCTQDHIIAERKRREKLNQRFKALSAIIPGLMKMDKASVLEYSTAYVKQLQERVKILEEKISNKTTESVAYVKKLRIPTNNDSNSTDESFTNEPLPEIEIRVSDRNVLIRIHCEKEKGVVLKTLMETEKHNLSVVNSSVIPFGTSILDITVVAQMNEEFNLTLKDLVKNLHAAFVRYM